MKRRGIVAGLLAAATALGVAELMAAFIGPVGSPATAVGGAFIDRTPRWLKEFAIATFAENDKAALLIGMALTVAALAAAIGVVACRHLRVGIAAVLLLGVVPAVAAVSRPTGTLIDAIPALTGALAGAACLAWLTRANVHQDAAGDIASPQAGSRRAFLRVAVLVGVVGATAGVLSRVVSMQRLDVNELRAALRLPPPAEPAPALSPGANLKVPEVSPFYTSNADFYRVDTALSVPAVDSDTWTLRIHGMVDQEVTLSLPDLLSMPLIERDITLTCVSNEVGGKLLGNARWLGVRVQDLLEEAGVSPDADQIVSRSFDGMTIGTPTQALTDGRDALLAVAMNGEPLPVEHGFPVRMVVPGLYGYVSACKWIVEMEATTFAAYDPYWVERGWAEQAPIKTSSRIDTPRPLASLASSEVTVGGVAWAQQRGIESVEVRVDEGPWETAELADSGGIDSWRQWSWTWPSPTSGNHTLAVRATDGDGVTQSQERAEPFPNGSSGWHSVVVNVA